MNVTADALRQLHSIHQSLTDLRERMVRGPKQLAASEANLKRLQENHEAHQQTLMQARVQSDERQLQLKTAEDRILDMKRKKNECSTNKEFQTLIEQIAADEMATSVLADEILEIMEKIDGLQNVAEESKTQLGNSQNDFEKLKIHITENQQILETEIAKSSDGLVQAEKELPADFKLEYERLVKARKDDALTSVENGMCGGCFQMITPQMTNELQMARPVFCKACGRMLYLVEESN